MLREVSFNGIREDLTTFYIDDTTKTALETYKNVKTDGYELPVGGLGVTLTGDGTVGFGSASTPTTADALFGLIKSYSGANTVGVQDVGYATDVATKGALVKGAVELVVDNKGIVSTLTGAIGSRGIVIEGATTSNKLCTILL